MNVDGSTEGGTSVFVDPAAFCSVAARMLAAGGRDSVPAVITLLSQALDADVTLVDAASPRASSIPKPRIRRVAPDVIGLDVPAPIEFPVKLRDTVLAVLLIEPSRVGLPSAWKGPASPLGTITDLLALALAAGPGPDAATDVRSVARTWFELEESDRGELAGELHDGLIQSLVAARYLLDLASTTWPDGPAPWLEAIRESIVAALSDGRTMLNAASSRTRGDRGLRLALEELCDGARIPVQLTASWAPDLVTPVPPVVSGAAYRFVQAALDDLVARGGDAADVQVTLGASGLSVDVCAVGDHPAWPDEPGRPMRRWATRAELLGGSVLLQPASAHLRFGPADGEPASLPSDVHAGRTM